MKKSYISRRPAKVGTQLTATEAAKLIAKQISPNTTTEPIMYAANDKSMEVEKCPMCSGTGYISKQRHYTGGENGIIYKGKIPNKEIQGGRECVDYLGDIIKDTEPVCDTEEAPKRTKYCPLKSLIPGDSYCMGEDCAWWFINDCAMCYFLSLKEIAKSITSDGPSGPPTNCKSLKTKTARKFIKEIL